MVDHNQEEKPNLMLESRYLGGQIVDTNGPPTRGHRIRYYGLLASGKRADNIARARELLTLPINSC
jgi:hypothetical protein